MRAQKKEGGQLSHTKNAKTSQAILLPLSLS